LTALLTVLCQRLLSQRRPLIAQNGTINGSAHREINADDPGALSCQSLNRSLTSAPEYGAVVMEGTAVVPGVRLVAASNVS